MANGAQSYLWNTGSADDYIMVSTTGYYTVTGYSAQGCAGSASTYVTVYSIILVALSVIVIQHYI